MVLIMDDEKIAELGKLLSIFKQNAHTASINLKLTKNYRGYIVNLDSDTEYINLINLLGRIGGVFNFQVTPEKHQNHYRCSIINFNRNWENTPPIYP